MGSFRRLQRGIHESEDSRRFLGIFPSYGTALVATPGPYNISLEKAHKALLPGLQKADDMGKKMNIAVVDSGANLVAFVRMDDAWLGSADVAMKKAKTTVFFQMDSAMLGKMSQPGEPLYGIEVSNQGLISFGGGLVLKDTKVAKAAHEAATGE